MKSYSFTIKFKDNIDYFSQSKVTNDIRDLILYNGFVLGKNVNKLKKINVNGNEVKVSVSLLYDTSEKELEEAVDDIKSNLKKKKYKLIHKNSENSINNTKKKVYKRKTGKNKKPKNSNKSKTIKNKDKLSFFNLF